METQTKSKHDEARAAVPESKLSASNREQRRQQFGIVHGSGGMLSRFRSGAGTGRTPHFKAWMADLQIKSALQKTSLASLADRHDNALLATAYALLFKGGFKSVWDVTQAAKADLLAVNGIGPKRLSEVKADLAKHQVMVNW